jgi:hypothetical protein
MKRISKEVKAVADAHIKARIEGNFDNPRVTSKQEIIDALNEGKTFEELLNEIEIRFVSITSNILQRALNHTSGAYKKGVYKGFRILYSQS